MEKLSKKYGAIRLQEVIQKVRSWKYANSRGYYRVIRSPYIEPAKINILRPGEDVVWRSHDVTFDYDGGFWGYGGAWKEAQAVFKKTYFTK